MDKLMLMNEQINGIVWGKYMIFFFIVYRILAYDTNEISAIYPCKTNYAENPWFSGKKCSRGWGNAVSGCRNSACGNPGGWQRRRCHNSINDGRSRGIALDVCQCHIRYDDQIRRGRTCDSLSQQTSGWHVYRRSDDNAGEWLSYGLSRYPVCCTMYLCILWNWKCNAREHHCTYDHFLYSYPYLDTRFHNGRIYRMDHIR